MPDLKPTVELGPAIDVTLWRAPTAGMKLSLRLPLRFAFTVERSPEYIGWLFSPKLNLDTSKPGASKPPRPIGVLLGLILAWWATARITRPVQELAAALGQRVRLDHPALEHPRRRSRRPATSRRSTWIR